MGEAYSELFGDGNIFGFIVNAGGKEGKFLDGARDGVDKKIVRSNSPARFLAKTFAKFNKYGNVGMSFHIAGRLFML